jgi:N-acetylglucosaminyldiphosphoundecaprenol N-acetyl-beta-D-mannosaminyltransferase
MSSAAPRPGSVCRAPASDEIRTLGYRFHPRTKSELLDLLFADRPKDSQLTIASANLHGLYLFERHADYRLLHARPGTHVIIDGMPIVWLLRLLGHDVVREHRTTWLDWFEDALERAASLGRRVFILGHTPQTIADGLARAKRRWPTLAIAGADGFFDIEDGAVRGEAIAKVNAFAPDILFVGMGMPRQEIFVARCGNQLNAPVIGLGGAAFAYFAGDQASPPRWMGRAGLEWLHRLAADPRRLAARYLFEPALLAAKLTSRLIAERAARRHPIESGRHS